MYDIGYIFRTDRCYMSSVTRIEKLPTNLKKNYDVNVNNFIQLYNFTHFIVNVLCFDVE